MVSNRAPPRSRVIQVIVRSACGRIASCSTASVSIARPIAQSPKSVELCAGRVPPRMSVPPPSLSISSHQFGEVVTRSLRTTQNKYVLNGRVGARMPMQSRSWPNDCSSPTRAIPRSQTRTALASYYHLDGCPHRLGNRIHGDRPDRDPGVPVRRWFSSWIVSCTRRGGTKRRVARRSGSRRSRGASGCRQSGEVHRYDRRQPITLDWISYTRSAAGVAVWYRIEKTWGKQNRWRQEREQKEPGRPGAQYRVRIPAQG